MCDKGNYSESDTWSNWGLTLRIYILELMGI